MASLVLGAVGAGVGSMFGYASIGWSIGSFIGGQLFGPKQPDIEGPRLADRTVSGSTYGQTIPKVYGTYRLSGEIIDSAAQYKEYKHKEEAGKGGGGGDYITYTYTATFAVGLCVGEIFGVRRIWFDGKLAYTQKETANPAEIAKTGEFDAKGITVYTGSETQEASPTLEAIHGAGNVPAYRGTAYIVFNELDITKFGRIPQITVEVVASGTLTGSSAVIARETISAGTVTLAGVQDGVLWMFCNKYGTGSGHTAAVFKKFSLADGSLLKSQPSLYSDGNLAKMSNDGHFAVFSGGGGSGLTLGFGFADTIASITALTFVDGYTKTGDSFVFTPSDKLKFWRDIYLWVHAVNTNKLYRFDLPNYQEALVLGMPLALAYSVVIELTDYGTFNLPPPAFCIDDMSGDVYVLTTNPTGTYVGTWGRYDADGNLIESRSGLPVGAYAAFSNGRLWVYDTNPDSSGVKVYDWDTGEFIANCGAPAARDSDAINGGTSDNYNHDFIAMGNIAFMASARVVDKFTLTLTPTAVGLDDVVSDICTSVGLEVSEIDVTALSSDTVRGYMISQQTPARGALEQLSAAYFFDGRESDGVLEFVKRGGVSIATLDDDDLGCYESGDPVELAEATRTQEEELPKALTFNYADINFDYQPGAQYALRQSTLNGTETTISLPIVFSADEAKDVVDKWMFSAWENRHSFKLATWQKYAKIDPADIITARGQTLRVTARSEGVNGIIELDCVRELPEIYSGQIGSGAGTESPEQSLTIVGPTESYLLDIPPLRDGDYNQYGFYWAASGLLDDWYGATLLEVDSSTYTSVSATNSECVGGNCITVLGDFDGGNIFDEINIVRVHVFGTLESKTRLEVLNGANVAAIKAGTGWEIIQYRDATLVEAGVYDLSGLLRGRLGTEQLTDAHAIGDAFITLTQGALRFIDQEAADIGTTTLYGAVSHGNTTDTLDTEAFAFAGKNVSPIVPDHIGGGMPNLATGWTIKWMRRSRYDWKWNNGRDVGADEASYNFEVRIYAADLTTIKRTITVTGATASGGYFSTTYSNANMTTDFGSLQRTIYVSVRQVGSMGNSDWSDIVTLASPPVGLAATVLIHGNGTDGSTSITDDYGHAVTVTGDAQVDTAFTDYFGTNNGVILLDGTGDNLSISATGITPASSSQAFTVDCRAYFDTAPDGEGLICVGNSVYHGTILFALGFCNGTAGSAGGAKPFFGYYDAGVGWRAAVSSDSLTTGTDYHIEGGYDGSKFYVFVNGVLKGVSAAGINSVNTDQPIYFGRRWDTAGTRDYVAGKMYEMRILRGEISHTSDFTPPASAYTE